MVHIDNRFAYWSVDCTGALGGIHSPGELGLPDTFVDSDGVDAGVSRLFGESAFASAEEEGEYKFISYAANSERQNRMTGAFHPRLAWLAIAFGRIYIITLL